MPTGYTRQSAAEIVTGQTINASSFNNEFNAIQTAMDVSAGHTHDGTVGGGAPITLTTSVTGILPIANGGTNASTAAGARTNLGLTIGTNVQAYDAGLQSISGLTTAANKMIYTTALDTYAVTDLTAAGRALLDDADATAQRTTLGLGTLSTQNANSVSVTGGTITGITDLSIADGGTGASDAATARTNLGLAIGTNVQAYDPALQSISGLTTAANQLIYTTASDTYAVTGLTAAGRAILDDADAAAQRATLGLGTIATQNASSVSVTTLSSESFLGNAQISVPGAQTIQIAASGSIQGLYTISASGGGNHHKLVIEVAAQQFAPAQISVTQNNNYTGSNLLLNPRVVGSPSGDTRYFVIDTAGACTVYAGGFGVSPSMSLSATPGGSTVIGNSYPLYVESNSAVGIGTRSPAVKLHVSSSYTSPTGGIDAGIQCAVTNTAGYSGLQILSGNTQSAYIHLGDTDDADRGAIIYDHSTDSLRINVAADERVRISSTGLTVGSAELTTPTGSAPLYAARAWVNFNGTGTVAIRASGNVTSITDNNTGDYTVNFTTAMPDANYCVVMGCNNGTNAMLNGIGLHGSTTAPTTFTTSAVRIVGGGTFGGSSIDMSHVSVIVYR